VAKRRTSAAKNSRAEPAPIPLTPPQIAERILSARHGPGVEERILELESELSDLRNELERSERRVEAMKQIGRVLGSNLDLDPLLSEIVSRTTDLLEADRSTLFLVDDEKDELWSKVLEGKGLREIRLPKGSGIAGWVAEHGKPLHIRNAYKDKRFNPEFDRQSGYRTRAMLVWPVRRPQKAEVIAVIQVLNKRSGPFNPTDERLLEAIASEIGVALEVATLYREAVERSEALERARRELLLLFETERAISQSDSLREMLESILETALTTMDAKAGAIHVLDERGIKVEVLAARGTHAASLRQGTIQVGEGVVGNVIKTGEPVVLNEMKGMKRGRIVAKENIAVPIHTRYDGTIGVLELINKKGRRGFDDDDVKALTVVAAQAGRAIRAERRRKEREQSERLTTIGRMLSGVVHDIRTPMTLISGYTQIMALCEHEPDRSKYAHQVHKQIEILTSMTRDLLAFARGERNILIRKVYVQRFMQEMKEYLEREFEGSGVKLEADVRYRGAARFDENKMRRVFHNIARNAREAMPGGGRFTIRASKAGDQLVFDFADTGSGVPPELEGRLFEPFATSGKVGGTGLGLAMVRQIAEEHRGSIDYKSSRRGTTFSLSMPLEE
jgi:signal transduction histidine kinase